VNRLTIRRAELAVIRAAKTMDDEGPSTDLNTWDAWEVIQAVRRLKKAETKKEDR
jgi:hypothetical protein